MKLDQALHALFDVADEAETVIYAASIFATNVLAFEAIPPDVRHEVVLACKTWRNSKATAFEKSHAFLVIQKALKGVVLNGN